MRWGELARPVNLVGATYMFWGRYCEMWWWHLGVDGDGNEIEVQQ